MAVRFDAMMQAAKSLYNITLTKDQIAAEWGKPFETIMVNLFGTIDPLPLLKEKYFRFIRDKFKAIPQDDALEIVQYLKAEYILAIITSASDDIFTTDFIDAGFHKEDFYSIQTADDSIIHKPDPAVFTITLERLLFLHIKEPQITYIGDGLFDAQAATDAHINFIAITTGLTTKKEFIDYGIKEGNIIDSLQQLHQVI